MTQAPHSTLTNRARMPDWERIETQYRIGTMSLREIALAHGITEGAIRKRAKRDTWPRDLAAKARLKADALVRKEAVRTEVRKPTSTEKAEVEFEANVMARVRLSHRKDIASARGLVGRLLGELEQQAPDLRLASDIEKALSAGLAAGTLAEKAGAKLIGAARQALSLGSRANIAKSLLDALRTSVNLEREAFGLDVPGNEPAEDGLTSLLRNLKARNISVVTEDLTYGRYKPSPPARCAGADSVDRAGNPSKLHTPAPLFEGPTPAAEPTTLPALGPAPATVGFRRMSTGGHSEPVRSGRPPLTVSPFANRTR